jgi:hypothetical protein
MRIKIVKDNHPSNEELITSMLVATDFLNPEHDKEDVLLGVLQLVSEKVNIYSPTKKKIYNVDNFKDEYHIHPKNYLLYNHIIL